MRRQLVVVGTLVWALVATAGAATARDGAYSPSGTYVADPDNASFELSQAGYRCPKAVTLPKPPAKAQALKDANAALTKLAGAKALKAFAKSKAYKSADAIPESVMTGMATGRPAAALAASLRGAVLEPTQPRHLINAAVILIGYGDLKQANELVTAAGKMKSTGAALSLTEPQELAAAKAELDVATGHPSLAEQIYRKLVGTDPGILGVNDGLAQALKCQGKLTAAFARHSRGQREMFDYVAAGDPGGDGLPPEVDAGSVDETAGKDIGSFGSYYRPFDQDDAAAHAAALDAASQAAFDRAHGIQMQQSSVPYGSPAGQNYMLYAQLVLTNDKQSAQLLAAASKVEADFRDDVNLGLGVPCYYSHQHATLWNFVDSYFNALAAEAHRTHKLGTALAAGVSDPPTNKSLNLGADYTAAILYQGGLAMAAGVADVEKTENSEPTCRANNPTPEPGTGTFTPIDPGADADPCSAGKVERVKIKLGKTVAAEFNCEGGKVEVVPVKYGVDEAYIGAFGEAGVKWKSGDITAVSGVKVSVSTPEIPGLPAVGVSGKAGVYVTVGKSKPGELAPYGETRDHWAVKDWGVRLQGTAEVPGSKIGSVTTITKFDSKVDFTLVGVFN
jgi:hypothetical protein